MSRFAHRQRLPLGKLLCFQIVGPLRYKEGRFLKAMATYYCVEEAIALEQQSIEAQNW